MRRGKKTETSISDYIDMRVKQLAEDRDRAREEYDKQWYNRIISELNWAKSRDHNCFMGDGKP